MLDSRLARLVMAAARLEGLPGRLLLLLLPRLLSCMLAAAAGMGPGAGPAGEPPAGSCHCDALLALLLVLIVDSLWLVSQAGPTLAGCCWCGWLRYCDWSASRSWWPPLLCSLAVAQAPCACAGSGQGATASWCMRGSPAAAWAGSSA